MKRTLTSCLLVWGLSGCGMTGRPDQENFTIRASQSQIEGFVRQLSQTFGQPSEETVRAGGVPFRVFAFGGLLSDLGLGPPSLVVTQVPDDRCDSRAFVDHYGKGEYRLDLLYGAGELRERGQAKNALIRAAHSQGLRITDFAEC